MNYVENLKVAIAAVEAQPVLALARWRSPCGTIFCIAGLCATLPHFNALGLYADDKGAPRTDENDNPFEVMNAFFGHYMGAYDPDESAYELICVPSAASPWDQELLAQLPAEATDKDLALARLRKALAIQEARQ